MLVMQVPTIKKNYLFFILCKVLAIKVSKYVLTIRYVNERKLQKNMT